MQQYSQNNIVRIIIMVIVKMTNLVITVLTVTLIPA